MGRPIGSTATITPEMAAGLALAVECAGGTGKLAAALGLDRAAVWRWRRVPAERCGQIEKLFGDSHGLTRAILRPDLFGEEA